MSFVFVIFLVLAGFALEAWMKKHGLRNIYSTYGPEENIVDTGETFGIKIHVENRSKWPVPYVKINMYFPKDIKVTGGSFRFSKESGRGGGLVETSVWMRPGQRIQMEIPVTIGQRGRYVLSHPNILGGDFLGLSETRQEIKIFREVIAAPEPQADEKTRELLGSFLGDYSVQRYLYEDPVMTAGYREYTGREPMKQISWKQSAHSMGLMVREYDHTVEPVLTLLLNVETAQERKEPVLEKCYSLARTVCQELEDRGIKYVFCTNAAQAGAVGGSHMVREGLGHQHFLKVLECLGRGLYHPAFSKEKLLELLGQDISRGVMIITPFHDDFRECGQFRKIEKMFGNGMLMLFGCERGGAEHDLDA